MRATLVIASLGVALATRPGSLPAQTGKAATTSQSVTLVGVVRDTEGRPLAAAEVIVDARHHAITNSRGEFSISGLPAGTIDFSTRRIGYSPVTTGVKVDPGLTVSLEVTLVPVAVELGTIVVEGKRIDKALWQTGFYKRRDAGAGHYFDAEYMKHFQASIGSLLGTLPSVRVDHNRGTTRALGRLPNGDECMLSVFVDGNFLPWASSVGLEDVVNRDDVLAIEVYPRAAEMPATVAGLGGAAGRGNLGTVTLRGASLQSGTGFRECGAMLIWTKPLGENKKR